MIESLYQIADELRAIANLGIHYSDNSFDVERYQKVLEISARILAELTGESSEEVLAIYQRNMTHVSPLNGAGTVLYRDDQILLIKRSDDGLWAIPGGLVEVGETAAEAAIREFYEEVGVRSEVKRLLGVFDSRNWKSNTIMQLFHFVFQVETDEITFHTSSEALDVGFFSENDLPPLSPGHHLRVPLLFKQLRDELPIPYFDLKST